MCSNSLRSDDPLHAAGLLKREMEAFGSLIIGAARAAAVPAGSALAVDRDRFAERITTAIGSHPRIELRRDEVTELPDGDTVIATGPLTSEAMSGVLQRLLGSEYLYFYDAIAPIVEADSVDMSQAFWQSRWDKGEGADYLNCPMDREQYLAFHQAVTEAEVLVPHDFEKAVFFEGCLPIEELARRGVDTLRYGPMKPVGLRTPDGRRPYAVVQLRQENLTPQPLQHGGLPVADEVGRAAAGAEHDPGPGAGAFRALRPDPPQHLHQRADPSGQALPAAQTSRASAWPARSRASRATSNRPPPASRSVSISPWRSRAASPSRSRRPRPSARSPGTSPSPTRSTSSRPTSTTACSPSWKAG